MRRVRRERGSGTHYAALRDTHPGTSARTRRWVQRRWPHHNLCTLLLLHPFTAFPLPLFSYPANVFLLLVAVWSNPSPHFHPLISTHDRELSCAEYTMNCRFASSPRPPPSRHFCFYFPHFTVPLRGRLPPPPPPPFHLSAVLVSHAAMRLFQR